MKSIEEIKDKIKELKAEGKEFIDLKKITNDPSHLTYLRNAAHYCEDMVKSLTWVIEP